MKFRVLKKIVKMLYGLSSFNGKPFKFTYGLVDKKRRVSSDMPESTPIDRVTPESVGIETEYIDAYFRELKNTPEVVTHSLVVTKDGKLIANYNTYPYDNKIWHTSFSMSKSVVGIAVGIAIDEGYMSIHDKIGDKVDFTLYGITPDPEVEKCTVRDLLTMTARVDYGEDGALAEADWLKGFMQAGNKKGEGFRYNSMCTFVLAFLVSVSTGRGFSEYVREKLFEPLGIHRVYFEKNALGQEKAGFGLLILPEDMAKLGSLVLNGGVYDGKRIVSAEYIGQMISVQAKVPEYVSRYDYGYQTWCKDDGSVYIFNGMFGQNVFMFPHTGIVVAVTGGDNDMFHDNPVFDVTYKYFSDLAHHPDNFENESEKNAHASLLKQLNGNTYRFGKKACRTGLMPIVSGVFQGNYPTGLKRITFNDDEMVVEEILDTHTVPLDDGARFVTEINGERYEIATRVSGDEDRVEIKFHFLELASTRTFIIRKVRDGIELKSTEAPGVGFLRNGQKMVLDALKGKKFLSWLLSRRHKWLWKRVDKTLEPKLIGKIV